MLQSPITEMSPRSAAVVSSSSMEGSELGVGGTPTFYIVGPDGRVVVILGPQPLIAFERIILSMLSE